MLQEKVIDKIVTAMENENAVNTINVQKNISLQGLTSEHQVDIYWEYTISEMTFKTVVQLQGLEKCVTSSDIFRLSALLKDIPGQVSGVIFTQPVYQRDVLSLARDMGIILYEIRTSLDESFWEPIIENIKVDIDKEWARQEKERLGIADQMIQITGNPRYLFLYDDENNCIDSIQGIMDRYIKESENNNTEKRCITHNFDKVTFLETNNELVPKVKVNAVGFDLFYEKINCLEGMDIVRYILNSVFKH